MATLTAEEQAKYDELSAKRDAPEVERSIEIRIDLSDPKAIRRGVACGYLDESLLDGLEDDDKGEDDDEGEDEDEQPRKPQGLPSSRRKPKPKQDETDETDEKFTRRYR